MSKSHEEVIACVLHGGFDDGARTYDSLVMHNIQLQRTMPALCARRERGVALVRPRRGMTRQRAAAELHVRTRLAIARVAAFGVEVTRMSTAKEDLMRLIQDQPDDSSSEEIVRELAFHVVERGLADSDARRVISNDEMMRRIRSWRS